jgi:NifB/MoaA-like Fe-S oxidoreductase
VPGISAVKKLDATTDLLYEMYDSQISIMHASVGGIRKSLKLEYPATQMSFSW